LIVGHCTGVALDDVTGFISMFITDPKYQGRGIGKQVLQVVMHSLGNRNAVLDSVPHMCHLYQQFGYQLGELRVYSQTIPVPLSPVMLPVQNNDAEVMNISEEQVQDVLAYDRCIHPTDRSDFMKRWINSSTSIPVCVYQQGKLCGYSVGKATQDYNTIGPLYADNVHMARILLMAVMKKLQEIYCNTGDYKM
jgi:hypothetical protein